MKNFLRPLFYAAYGVSLFLMLLLPYHRYDWASVEPLLAAGVWEDTGEGAHVIHLSLLICVLSQSILAVNAESRRERIVCVALLLLACILWGVKAYG
jgi:hypothetical protein